MSVLYYLLPVMVIWIGEQDYRGPAYLEWRMNPDGMVVTDWTCIDYGSINRMVCAVDASPEQHAQLATHADVYQFPANVDTSMPQAEMTGLTTFLEGTYLPAQWLAGNLTYRQVLRTITGMYLFMQRLTTLSGNVSPLDWGISLNTQYRNLSTQQQAWIAEAFASLGYDASFIRSNTTVRQILKAASDQWGAKPILFGFATL